MGRQRRQILANFPGGLDICCHDIFSVHVTHQDVHLDAVSEVVSYRQLQISMVDVCVLHYGIWSGCYLLESVRLCACQSQLVSCCDGKRKDEEYANWCRYRDLTVSASHCINKQAFYIGNGVMNIISEFLRYSSLTTSGD